uniref:Uncharacterized protein n=1 Tax=Trichogramma kaykai TaxID=54128 RepID=A0ABD2XPB6_9HYME
MKTICDHIAYKETSETLTTAGDEYVFDSLHNHIKIENYESLSFHEILQVQKIIRKRYFKELDLMNAKFVTNHLDSKVISNVT